MKYSSFDLAKFSRELYYFIYKKFLLKNYETWKPIVFRITFIVILQLMSKLTYHKDKRRLLDISVQYLISTLVHIFRLISNKQASLDKRNLTTINYPFSKNFVREFFKDLILLLCII